MLSEKESFRNQAAIHALQGLLAGGMHTSDLSYDQIAEESGKYADALTASCFDSEAA